MSVVEQWRSSGSLDAMAERTLTLLTCNIQAGSRTASYGDYITRGWSNVLPAGKRGMLDAFARLITSRSEEHTSELQSLMRNSYAVFCLQKTQIPKNIQLPVQPQ